MLLYYLINVSLPNFIRAKRQHMLTKAGIITFTVSYIEAGTHRKSESSQVRNIISQKHHNSETSLVRKYPLNIN